MGKQPSLEVGVTHYHIPPNHRRAGIGVRLTNVKQSLTEVGEVELADVPQMEPVRKRLLAKAQRFYLDFLEEKRTDPNLLREAGRAYCRLGEIQEILGEYPSAERAFRQAIELLEEQSAQRPAGVDTRPDLVLLCRPG